MTDIQDFTINCWVLDMRTNYSRILLALLFILPCVASAATVPEDPPEARWRIDIAYRTRNPETETYQRYRATLASNGRLTHGEEHVLANHVPPSHVRSQLSAEETTQIYRAVAKVINSYELKEPGKSEHPPLIQWMFKIDVADSNSVTVEDGSNQPAPEVVHEAIALLCRIHQKYVDEKMAQPEDSDDEQ